MSVLSAINPARYAVQALLTTTGAGVNSSPLVDWWILVLMSLVLIVLLAGLPAIVYMVRLAFANTTQEGAR